MPIIARGDQPSLLVERGDADGAAGMEEIVDIVMRVVDGFCKVLMRCCACCPYVCFD